MRERAHPTVTVAPAGMFQSLAVVFPSAALCLRWVRWVIIATVHEGQV